jgi:pyroglutamyl-peptidase
VLHIGLSTGRTFYTLEKGAHRIGYGAIADVDGYHFTDEEAKKQWPNLPSVLETGFKTEDVWQRFRKELSHLDVDVRPSEDAGNFLCGFIYYTSMAEYYKLSEKERPVIFLHVPDLPTKDKLDQGREITCALIRALVESNKNFGAGNSTEENSDGERIRGIRQEADANFSEVM